MKESYIKPFLEIIESLEDDTIHTSGPVEDDDDWTTNEGGWDGGSGNDKEDDGYSGYY